MRVQIFTSIHVQTLCARVLAGSLGFLSYPIPPWVCPNVEIGCERKSVGSGGVEPRHPVVTGHTCPLVCRQRQALTFVGTVCEFWHWVFLLHHKTNRERVKSPNTNLKTWTRTDAAKDKPIPCEWQWRCIRPAPSSCCTVAPVSWPILNGPSTVTWARRVEEPEEEEGEVL